MSIPSFSILPRHHKSGSVTQRFWRRNWPRHSTMLSVGYRWVSSSRHGAWVLTPSRVPGYTFMCFELRHTRQKNVLEAPPRGKTTRDERKQAGKSKTSCVSRADWTCTDTVRAELFILFSVFTTHQMDLKIRTRRMGETKQHNKQPAQQTHNNKRAEKKHNDDNAMHRNDNR